MRLPRWSSKGTEADGRTFVFLGRHGVGKTSCMSHVLSKLGKTCHDWIGFSPTEGGVEMMRKMMPKAFVYNVIPTDADIEHFITIQKKRKKLWKKHGIPFRKIGIILDDVGYKKKWLRNSEKMLEVVHNQRHLGICLFITIQYILQISPEIHSQVDYLFQMSTGDPQSNAKSFESFFQGRLNVPYGVNQKRRELIVFTEMMSLYADRPGQALVVQRSRKPYISFHEWPEHVEYPRIGDEEYWASGAELAGDESESEDDMEEDEEHLRRMLMARYKD